MSGVVLLVVRIFMAGALYLFLGWMVWVLWNDIKKENLALVNPQLPTLFLVTNHDGEENSQHFHSREIMIGRDPICDLRLEDKTISARHAKLAYRQGQWWVEDLHSKNGTLLNLAPVSAPVVVTSGDKLQCGQVEVQIRLNVKPAEREGQ